MSLCMKRQRRESCFRILVLVFSSWKYSPKGYLKDILKDISAKKFTASRPHNSARKFGTSFLQETNKKY